MMVFQWLFAVDITADLAVVSIFPAFGDDEFSEVVHVPDDHLAVVRIVVDDLSDVSSA